MDSLTELARIGIVPVVTVDDAATAPDLAAALAAGGIGAAEIALRTPDGLEAIKRAADVSGVIVGAGTVLTPEQVDQAVDVGARFIVSPGLNPAVVERAQELLVPVLPGVATASEVQAALRLGVNQLKLFPASVLGGTKLLDALRGPFPDVSFLPSGGVSIQNAVEYARHPSVFAIGGSWMVERSLIAGGRFDEVTRLSAEAVALIRG
ncbi:bifunctional 4-hydroxy-2-oxoglutarate aldolase/2-dehydro-3-deoxy-phosphogluconate aldolase [Diaminobutyricimonas sp. TR449]|uniref:bifunctional 4-hydroxy-2-oxoglutarate aldolase/2-dehydro-3-deoxy-phosphogluconate aldolase n=1 Tax=Diaminobutyricimonas sp. TR449 TaxID=2708076 RepID=UPI00141E3FCF|nr:bifunctional 4-hydroxy-2-oxoglutarate aldolase/2-dehydro-3-deoxy-phosphogluconate aldolase [Diaminobutyricimonas sp. TR449]